MALRDWEREQIAVETMNKAYKDAERKIDDHLMKQAYDEYYCEECLRPKDLCVCTNGRLTKKEN